jgi:hypothetical protein
MAGKANQKAYYWYELFDLEKSTKNAPEQPLIKIKTATTITYKELDYIFLGTEDGKILKYRVADRKAFKDFEERARTGPAGSPTVTDDGQITVKLGRPIMQLDSFTDPTNLLLALCDGRVIVYDSTNLEEKNVDIALNTDGVQSFSLCKKTVRVVMQSRANPRILYLYKMARNLKLIKSIFLSDHPNYIYVNWPAIILTYKRDKNYWFVNGEEEAKKPQDPGMPHVLATEVNSSLVYGPSGPCAAVVHEPEIEDKNDYGPGKKKRK